MLNLSQYFPITDPTLIFFVVLLMILLSPIIMGRLRIPHIIGMVLAGVLVGKYGLNILGRDASFELFSILCGLDYGDVQKLIEKAAPKTNCEILCFRDVT